MGFGSRPFCGKEAYQPASVARDLQEQWQGRIRRRVRWRSRHLEGGARLGLQDSPWRPHRACRCSPCRQWSSGKQANKLHPACSCQVPTYQSSIPICLSAMPIHWSFMPIRQSSLPSCQSSMPFGQSSVLWQRPLLEQHKVGLACKVHSRTRLSKVSCGTRAAQHVIRYVTNVDHTVSTLPVYLLWCCDADMHCLYVV